MSEKIDVEIELAELKLAVTMFCNELENVFPITHLSTEAVTNTKEYKELKQLLTKKR